MIVAAIYVSLLAAIAAFWLVRQDLAAKPWLEQGVIGDAGAPREGRAPRVGLWLFLGVVGALFALLASAYVMRMDSPDWRLAPMPRLLWINTGVLIASSLALQASVFAARRNEAARARFWLLTGAVAAVAFLAGQLLAWREFAAAGYFLSTNPANAFFYLITGLHGVHLAGGLAALTRAVVRARGDILDPRAQSAIALCAVYWHFLMVVWLILFALLTGWAGEIVVICRGLIA